MLSRSRVLEKKNHFHEFSLLAFINVTTRYNFQFYVANLLQSI